ncbi:MAG: hypothetical protein LBK71_03340 [Verrucomicrobiales bacterium]|jgi:hypothetical protein|nr:hypothetical protein [Verrucomicrobiales bacterium]
MMSDCKISESPEAQPVTGDELTPVVQSGETRKTTVNDLVANEAAVRAAAIEAEGSARAAADDVLATGQTVINAGIATFAVSDYDQTGAITGHWSASCYVKH